MEYTVTTLADNYSYQSPVPGSLRYAIAQANAYTGDEEVVITISDELEGEILLKGDIFITREMTINNNATASVSIPNSYYKVRSSTTLTLNDMVLSEIYLRPGAKLEGAGNIFTSWRPIYLENWSGTTDGVLSLLGNSTFESENAEIYISSLSGDATLCALPPGVSSYNLNGLNIGEGQTLTVEDGVVISGYVHVGSGGTLDLEGAQIGGSIYLSPGSTLKGDGNIFTSWSSVYLENWSGTTDGVLSSLDNATFEPENAVIYISSLSGDAILCALPPGVSSYNLNGFSIGEGQTLMVKDGVVISGYVHVGSGGTLDLEGAQIGGSIYLSPGSTLKGDGNIFTSWSSVYLENWSGTTDGVLSLLDNSTFESENAEIYISSLSGDATLCALPPGVSSYNLNGLNIGEGQTLMVKDGVVISGSVHVGFGGTLDLEGAIIEGDIYLSPGSTLKGDGNIFTSLSSVCLENWSGTTDGVLSLLGNSTFESENAEIYILSLSGDATLCALPPGVSSYNLNGLNIGEGQTLTVEDGVVISGSVHVGSGETLDLEGAIIEGDIYLSPGATLKGDGNIFTSWSPVCLENWSGTTDGVLSLLGNSTFESENAGIYISSLSGDATLCALPPGVSSYNLNWLNIGEGQTLTVEAGVAVSGGYVRVGSGETLDLEGAIIEGSIYLSPGATLKGDGNIFTSWSPVCLENWIGTTSGVLSSLGNSTFESENAEICISSLSGDAILCALPPGVSSYNLNGLNIGEGQTLTVEDGVVISGSVYVGSGGELRLDGAKVNGTITINPGGSVCGDNVVIGNSAFFDITLSGWNGETADCLKDLNILSVEDGRSHLSYSIQGLEGNTVRWDEATKAHLAHGMPGSPELRSLFLLGQDVFIIASGEEMNDVLISVGGGTTLRCEKDVAFVDASPDNTRWISVVGSGKVEFDGTRLEIPLILSQEARISGSLLLDGPNGVIRLDDSWEGTTEALWTEVLREATVQGANLRVELDGLNGGVGSSVEHLELTALPEALGVYYLNNWLSVDGLALGDNTELMMGAYGALYVTSQLVCKSGSRIYSESSGVSRACIELYGGGCIIVNDSATFEVAIDVDHASSLQGEGEYIFACKEALTVTLPSVWEGGAAIVDWLTSMLPARYRVTAQDAYISYSEVRGTNDFPWAEITPELLDSLTPQGFAHCTFVNWEVGGGKSLEIAPGVEMYISSNLTVRSDGELICSADSKIHGIKDANTLNYRYSMVQPYIDNPILYVEGRMLAEEGAVLDITLGIGENAVLSGSCQLAAQEAMRYEFSQWDGTAESLSKPLSGLNYQVTRTDAYCSLAVQGLATDLELSNEKLTALCPEGIRQVRFSYLYVSDRRVSVAEGTDLYANSINVGGRGSLTMGKGSRLLAEESSSIYVSGELELNGVDLNGAEISVSGGRLTMNACSHIGNLVFYTQAHSVVAINNCDFSDIEGIYFYGAGGVVDLSGNYWGTTDMNVILSKIEGGGSVIINNILDSPDIAHDDLDLVDSMFGEHKINEAATSIVLRFNNYLDASTATPDSIHLLDAQGNRVNLASVEAKGKNVTLRWSEPLQEGQYRVLVSREVRDVYGQGLKQQQELYYTCEVGDFTWDALMKEHNTLPESATKLTLYFNHRLDSSSVTPGSIRLLDAAGQEVELQNVECEGYTAILHFSALEAGEYRIAVADTLRDVHGRAFSNTLEPAYTSEPGVFTWAEDIQLHNNVAAGLSSLVLTFNQVIDTGTVNAQSVVLSDEYGNSVAVQNITGEGKTLTLHFAPLGGGNYSVRVSGGLKDVQGHAFQSVGDIHYIVAGQDAAKVLLWDCRNTVVGNFHYADIYFDRPMDAASLTPDSVHLVGADGQEQKITRIISAKNAGNVFYRVYFETVSVRGDYTLRLDNTIRSADGMALAANCEHGVMVSSPDLIIPQAVSVDASTIGMQGSITWRVCNEGDALSSATWVDTVYLCKTPEWDPGQAIVLGRVTHRNVSLEHGESVTSELKTQWTADFFGDCYIFVVSNESGNLGETDIANNISPVKAVKCTVPGLDYDSPQEATPKSLNELIYYTFEAKESGTCRIALTGAVKSAWGIDGELSATTDQVGRLSGNNLYMDVQEGQTYYVAIQPKSKGVIGASLSACTFAIHETSADRVGSGHSNRFMVYGSGFDARTRFYLEDSLGNRFETDGCEHVDSMTAVLAFNLPEGLAGSLQLKAYQDGTPGEVAEAPGLLTCVSAGEFTQAAELQFLQGMSDYRGLFNRPNYTWKTNITVSNPAPFAIQSPLVLITDTAPDFALYYSYEDSEVRDRSALLLLGGNGDATKGMLTSGERHTMDLCVKNYSSGSGSINATILSPTDTTVISEFDWQRYASALRPSNASDKAWNAWWSDMKPRIGTTVADFVAFVYSMQALAGDNAGSSLADITRIAMDAGAGFVPSQVLSGKLTDSEGEGIADAIIQVYRVTENGRELVGSTLTDTNGAYTLGGLHCGQTYELESSTAFVQEDGTKTTICSLGTVAGDILGVLLTTPETVAAVSVRLQGLVGVDEEDITVYLLSDTLGHVGLKPQNGVWVAENVESGDYTLRVHANGHAGVEKTVSLAKGTENGFEVSLNTLCAVSGKLFRADGTSAPAGTALALVRDGKIVSCATTAADGSYTFTDVAEGTYGIQAVDFPGSLVANVQVPAATPALELPPARIDFGHTVTGGITGGKPGMSVELRAADGTSYYAELDSEGKFCVQGVPAGTYRLFVEGIELNAGYGLACGAGEEAIDAGTHAWVQAARIEGSLTDFGHGVRGVVDLYRDGTFVASSMTDAQGCYGFSVLQTGEYTVRGRTLEGCGTTEAVTCTVSGMEDAISLDCPLAHGSFQIANANDWIGEQEVKATLYMELEGNRICLGSRSGIQELGRAYTQLSTGRYTIVVETADKYAEQAFEVTDEELVLVDVPELKAWGGLALSLDAAGASVYVYDAVTYECVAQARADWEGKVSFSRLAGGCYVCTILSADNTAGTRVEVAVAEGEVSDLPVYMEPLSNAVNGSVGGVESSVAGTTFVSVYDENGILAGLGSVGVDGVFDIRCVGTVVGGSVVVRNATTGQSGSADIGSTPQVVPVELPAPEAPTGIPDPLPLKPSDEGQSPAEPGTPGTPEEPEETQRLIAPTGLSQALDKKYERVTLSWDAAGNPPGTTYEILYCYRPAVGGAWTGPFSVDAGTATSHTRPVSNNYYYAWKVVAHNPQSGASVASTEVNYVVDFDNPSAPSGLKTQLMAEDGDGKKNDALLSWAPSTDEFGVKGYYIACGSTPDRSKYETIFVEGISARAKDLKDGIHYWWVCAVDENDHQGEWTSGSFFVDTTPPSKVTNVKSVGQSHYTGFNDTWGTVVGRSAVFTWNAAQDKSGIEHYEVEITRRGSSEVRHLSTTNTRILVSLTTPGDYVCRVRAVDTYGNVGEWNDLPYGVVHVDAVSEKNSLLESFADIRKEFENISEREVRDVIKAKCCSTDAYRKALRDEAALRSDMNNLLDERNGYLLEIGGNITAALWHLVLAVTNASKLKATLGQSDWAEQMWNNNRILKVEAGGLLHGNCVAVKLEPSVLADVIGKIDDLLTYIQPIWEIGTEMKAVMDSSKSISEKLECVRSAADSMFELGDALMSAGLEDIANYILDDVTGELPDGVELVDPMSVLESIISEMEACRDRILDVQQGIFDYRDYLDAARAKLTEYENSIFVAEYEKKMLLDCISARGDDCTPPPSPNGSGAASLQHSTFQSYDPNDIYGPQGVGERKWVGVKEMDFQVECENIAKENIAHAAMVTITEQLDEAFDWTSFRLGDMMLGGRYIEVPDGMGSYKARLDWTDTHGVLVDVDAGVDLDTGVVTWSFTAIDPGTGFIMGDPFKGILAPNYESPEGEGHFYYYVTPKETAASGTEFKAEASIVFDTNEPIDTPTLTYTLDADAPEAAFTGTPTLIQGRYLLVKWEGADVGSGVESFDVYVSTDGGDWKLWQSGLRDTQALFALQAGGHEYAFAVTAKDWVGNIGTLDTAPEKTLTVHESPQVSTLSVESVAAKRSADGAPMLTLTFNESAAPIGTWEEALQVLADGRSLNLTQGSFSYDESTFTLTWQGTAGMVSPGESLEVRLANGSVQDASGLTLATPAMAVQAGADLGKMAEAYAAPTFYDYNGDGLPDLLVGEVVGGDYGRVRIYLNTGTEQEAMYVTYTYAALTDGTPLTVEAVGCQGAIVRFSDLTGDGEDEMVIGLANGTVQYYTCGEQGWEAAGPLTCNILGKDDEVRVDSRAAVDFADMNGDGRADLLVGAGDGQVVLYYNIGTGGETVFDAGRYLHDATGILDVGSRASVVAADVDGDGLLDLLLGSSTGTVYYYHNYGTAEQPLFAEREKLRPDSAELDLSALTDRVRIDVADVNGDGMVDLVVGMSDGSVQLFMGKGDVIDLGAVEVETSFPAPIHLKANATPLQQPGSSLVAFSWNAVEVEDLESVTYELRYRLAGAAGYTVVECLATEAELTLPDGVYDWSVRATQGEVKGDWAMPVSLVLDTIAPDEPMPGTPEVEKQTVTLSWRSASEIGDCRYEVRYREEGSTEAKLETTTVPYLTLYLPAQESNYTWAVRAVDGAGNASEWVEGTPFLVDATAPGMPQEAMTVEVSETAAKLVWAELEDVSGIAGYRVEYGTSADFAGASKMQVTGTELTLFDLSANSSYYWRVAAVDKLGNVAAWTQGENFFTKVEVEDNTPQTATELEFQAATGVAGATEWVGFGDRYDYYKVAAGAGGVFDILLTGRDAQASPVYLSVGTLDAAGGYVAQRVIAVGAGSPLSGLDGVAMEGGKDYYIRVASYDGGAGTCNTDYTIEVRNKLGDEPDLPGGRVTADNDYPSARALSWQETDTAGICGWVGYGDAVDTYSFSLEQAASTQIKLAGIGQAARVGVYKANGQGGVTRVAAATAAKGGLDKELSLSAGSYYVQVTAYDNGAGRYNTAYTLDIETEIDGTRKQGVLAAV